MAPIARALEASAHLVPRVLVTGQHRDMVLPVLDLFGVRPSHALADDPACAPGLAPLFGHLLSATAALLRERPPALVLVQGDTSSAMGAGLAAYYAGIPLGHVEAGLRTGRSRDPFPEEFHRRTLSLMADIHFAPTEGNRTQLLQEGVDPERVHVTGNTVIDSVITMRDRIRNGECDVPAWTERRPGQKRVTVTLHRRESWDRIGPLCQAIRLFAERHPDWEVLFPVHPNPTVRTTVAHTLEGSATIRLTPPLRYDAFVAALMSSDLVVTDSGGIQEEAPVLGLPILVVRDVTERSELLDLPGARMTERHPTHLLDALEQFIATPAHVSPTSPFGDGHAATRITDHLVRFLHVTPGSSPATARPVEFVA